MPYSEKTNWKQNDVVLPEDFNKVEQGIEDLDNTTIKLTGDQLIKGIKTFETLPQSVATPTKDPEFITKKYLTEELEKYMAGLKKQEYYTAGSYTFTVPEKVTKISVTASAGGGAGGSNKSSPYNSGGGGGGGGLILGQTFTVTPLSNISITVGRGGIAGSTIDSNGGDGLNTIIGTLITLNGGKGGLFSGVGGLAGSTTAGNGGNGVGGNAGGGGGGGASYGAGGNGAGIGDAGTTVGTSGTNGQNSIFNSGGIGGHPSTTTPSNKGYLGSGGGGGARTSGSPNLGANGGDGFVIIEF